MGTAALTDAAGPGRDQLGRVVSWAAMATGDQGAPLSITAMEGAVAAVQFLGTFANGSTAVLQGSNDGTNWATLKDYAGSDISATAAALFDFSTAALYVRPAVTDGSSDAVTAVMVLRG